MYNYWGFTNQIPQTIFILNTGKSDRKVIGNVKYEAVKIDGRKYFGVQRIIIEDEEVCISDKERTLVDLVYKPIGSFDNVRKILQNNLAKIDLRKFIGYLTRFPVVSVRKRAGFILEDIGCESPLLRKMKKYLGNDRTYVVLDPMVKSRKGKIDNEWKIIVNLTSRGNFLCHSLNDMQKITQSIYQ